MRAHNIRHSSDVHEPNKPTPTKISLDWSGCMPAPCGLKLPPAMPEDDWCVVGHTLGEATTAAQWWIGDWWAFGEHRYGDRRALVTSEDWDGPNYFSCMNAASVCRAFTTSRRREVLSFGHHREVAGLPSEDADALLDWAEESIGRTGKPQSIRALREERARREHDRASGLQVKAEPESNHPVSMALHVEQVPIEPRHISLKIVQEPQAKSARAPMPAAQTGESALDSFRRCLSVISIADGVEMAALVDPVLIAANVHLSNAARRQIDAFLTALGIQHTLPGPSARSV